MMKRDIRPFRIEVPADVLSDLRKRLGNTRWPPVIEDRLEHWHGPSLFEGTRGLWARAYDWKKHEAKLNQLSHFRTEVDGIGIHFIHEKGKGLNPFPIVLTHGYPDSFLRFVKLIPMLSDPASFGGRPEDAFDVVVPDLPGYGFSDTTFNPQ